jgi:phage FluMu protein Com
MVLAEWGTFGLVADPAMEFDSYIHSSCPPCRLSNRIHRQEHRENSTSAYLAEAVE